MLLICYNFVVCVILIGKLDPDNCHQFEGIEPVMPPSLLMTLQNISPQCSVVSSDWAEL